MKLGLGLAWLCRYLVERKSFDADLRDVPLIHKTVFRCVANRCTELANRIVIDCTVRMDNRIICSTWGCGSKIYWSANFNDVLELPGLTAPNHGCLRLGTAGLSFQLIETVTKFIGLQDNSS